MRLPFFNRSEKYGFYAVLALLAISAALALSSCNKPDPAVVIPDKDPRIQLEKMGAVKWKDPEPTLASILPPQPTPSDTKVSEAPVAKPVISKAKSAPKFTKPGSKVDNAEAAALAKAAKNAERIKCLNAVVDYKIDRDIEAGEIRDWGSAITAKTCRPYMTQATPGTLVGIRAFGGPGVGLLLTNI
jgi:hypothetical protein